MFNAFFQSVIVKWITRRFLELGPVVSVLLTVWGGIGPAGQETVANILQGNWSLVTVGSLITIGGYVWSFVATVKPHATAHGVQVPTSQMSENTKAVVKDIVLETAARPRKPTLLDRLFKR